MEIFSHSLKAFRMGKEMTRAQLAKELGVAYSTYCNWENDNREPNLEMLVKIADYFKVSVDSLLRY